MLAPNARTSRSRRSAKASVEQRATKNRNKSRVRAIGEHPFLVLKRLFGFAKVCYRGIAKNANGCLSPVRWSICSWCDERCCDQNTHIVDLC